MRRMDPGRHAALAVAVLVALLTAAVPSAAAAPEQAPGQMKDCADPYPCDYRWEGPAGPFEVLPPERVTVTSHDGVKLNGFIVRPQVDVPVPVILQATPYMQAGSAPASFFVGGIPAKEFVSAGYAVAQFSVRGSGDSGGCFGFKSQDEQDDLPVIIDWLATQSWSNGRVGMQGLSYPGTTPVMAAIQNPPALKTIVIAGTILDEYGFVHSPQGASYAPAAMWLFGSAPGTTLAQSLFPWDPGTRIATAPERLCAEMVRANTTLPQGEITGQRDAEFWTTRRFIDHVPGITAATFVVHGFHDRYGSGHAFQDDWAWQSLASAPKRMLVGQWWHEWPNSNLVFGEDKELKDWPQRLMGWFDYWLKGWGDAPPGVGEVEFQDSNFEWHRTDAWPPPATKNAGRGHVDGHGPDAGVARRHDEVLYLREGTMTPDPGNEKGSFLSVFPPWNGGTDPDLTGIGGPAGDGWRWTSPCPDPTRLVYTSKPVEEPTLLAGNAHAWLEVDSSTPTGSFELQLYDLGPDFSCSEIDSDHVWPMTEGAVDLRYHESEDYRAHPFTPLTPFHVRVDLANLAEVLEPGHRLAVVVSHGIWRGTTPELFPLITLHGDGGAGSSHLVLPVVSGGFGGQEPTLDYPPKPFLPDCCTGTP